MLISTFGPTNPLASSSLDGINYTSKSTSVLTSFSTSGMTSAETFSDTEMTTILPAFTSPNNGPGTPRRLTLEDILGQYWEYTTARDLCLYGYPAILVLGTIGNLLTLVIMLRSGMRRRSTGLYLCAVSVFDTLVLYSVCFRQWLSLVLDSDVLSHSNAFCKTFNFLSYLSFDVAAWLLIVMTVERFLVVQFPLLSSKIATVKKAKTAIVVLILIMGALNIHFFWTVSVDENGFCKYTDSTRSFHDNVWPWIDATVYSFLPFILLLVVNILIILVHRRAIAVRKTTVRVHRSNERGTKFKLSTMLITVTMTFLFLSAPNVVLICIRHKYFNFSVKIDDLRDVAVYRLVAMVTNFCLYLNHAINFFLYCISGEKFRRELVNLFKCKTRRREVRSIFSDVTTVSGRLSESSAVSLPSVNHSEEERV